MKIIRPPRCLLTSPVFHTTAIADVFVGNEHFVVTAKRVFCQDPRAPCDFSVLVTQSH